MFVRFQERNNRLLVRLLQSRRVNGKVRQEHIAELGAIHLSPSPEARLVFWTTLHQTLSRLSNRVPDTTKILTAIHARVPMPSMKDNTEVQATRNQRSLRQWSSHLEGCREQIELNAIMKTKAEQNINLWQSEAARAEANMKAAQEAIATGQEAPKPLSPRELAKLYSELGLTKQRRHRYRKRAELSEDEFQAMLDRKLRPLRNNKGQFVAQ
jgi:hypothetical protein